MTKTVTLEEVMAARTPRGGWTKKQIVEWGIEYPPERGWIKRLTGDNSAAPPKCGSSLEAKRLRRMSRIELERENVRLREALEWINDQRYANRQTINHDNAFEMAAALNEALLSVMDRARDALGGQND